MERLEFEEHVGGVPGIDLYQKSKDMGFHACCTEGALEGAQTGEPKAAYQLGAKQLHRGNPETLVHRLTAKLTAP